MHAAIEDATRAGKDCRIEYFSSNDFKVNLHGFPPLIAATLLAWLHCLALGDLAKAEPATLRCRILMLPPGSGEAATGAARKPPGLAVAVMG